MPIEIELDDDALPKPGEPLQPAIDPANQAVLAEDLEERKRRTAGKLSKSEKKRLEKRYKQLWRYLNRVGWNDLITRRWETLRKYEALKFEYQQAKWRSKRKRIRDQAQKVAWNGIALDAKIAQHQPFADEFESISKRLEIHRQVVAWEKEDEENNRAFRREARRWEEQINAAFRQSKRLHHAGFDENNNWFCHIPRIQQIIFQADKVRFQIAVSEQNWLGKWSSALPYNVDVTALASPETIENMKAHTDRVVSVTRGEKGQGFFYVINRPDSPDGIPKRVLFSKVMPWYPVEDHAKTPWFAGVSEDRKVKSYNFEDAPHILIVGTTKSGKSNQVNQMIATWVTMNSPSEVGLIAIDLKGGMEFTHWKTLKHLVHPMIKSVDKVLPAIEWLREKMQQRIAVFESVKAKTLASYNSRVAPESRLRRVVLVIDELATLMGLGTLTTEIQNVLRDLASQGRAVGFHLVVCTQYVNADMLPGWITTNIVMRVAGFIPGVQASFAMIGSVSASQIPQDVIGRLVFSQGRIETICQSPFISDEEIADTVTVANSYPDADNREFALTEEGTPAPSLPPAIIQPVLKFTKDDLIKLALEQFNGKLTAINMHAVLGNEVITLRKLRELINQTIKGEIIHYQGNVYGLKKLGHNYILVKTGEELNMPNETENENAGIDAGSGARSDEDTAESEPIEEAYAAE